MEAMKNRQIIPIQRRAGKPKVKSGCITCKTRRVKCDETKPMCIRCQKFGVECDGYASEPTPPKRSKPSTPQNIVPRPASLLRYRPIMTVPGSEEERRYYQLFCDQTAFELGGVFPTDFWNRIVLQESLSEPFIRHAVVAIGALTKTLLDSRINAAAIDAPSMTHDKRHHEFALKQYNKAIVKLRHSLAKGEPQLRKALVACLLFVCFENFHGDYDAGSKHIQCGVSLLEQWQAQNIGSSNDRASSKVQLDGFIHDEVFQIFSRLDTQAFAHLGTESPLYPNARLLLWEMARYKGFHIPITFADLIEARKCWDILMQRTVHFHIILYSSNGAAFQEDSDLLREEKEKEKQACITLLQQFEEAIKPLMQTQPCTNIDSTTGAGATILYVSSKISNIFLDTCSKPGELQYDHFKPQFVEIMDTIEPVILSARRTQLSQTVARTFNFDTAMLLPLHLTALKCRDPQIRRRALALMLACPVREGAWDGVMLAKVDEKLMLLEEEGVEAGEIMPEEKRWRVIKIEADLQRRWIKTGLSRGAVDDEGVWRSRAKSKDVRITW